MRIPGVAIAACLTLSCGLQAAEPSATTRATEPVTTASASVYALQWQQRVLAAQKAFVETLPKKDPVETGTITPSAQ